MANTPAARTDTGEIKDASAPPPAAPAAPVGAPESYSDFKLPEGAEVNKSTLEAAAPVFKELGLSQDQAQKLVDLYSKETGGFRDQIMKAAEDIRTDWVNKVKADPEIGSKLDQVKIEIGRAKDKLPAEVRSAFNEAMDFTGAGDHPAVVKALYEFAKLVNEGTHVTGRGPSTEGQSPKGQANRPSIAGALYPNLAQ